ncbi:hypothetical protein J2Z31_001811 [Sinorhizobium kostiense]|uniref:Uncharacterized protein n=1 Tax=Sinorhizobium kostiense TaxID=76747 RepID=A0ABS4QZ09_9HYPH|nr:hypothetical protein [Sinorhizobium kostiense]
MPTPLSETTISCSFCPLTAGATSIEVAPASMALSRRVVV